MRPALLVSEAVGNPCIDARFLVRGHTQSLLLIGVIEQLMHRLVFLAFLGFGEGVSLPDEYSSEVPK